MIPDERDEQPIQSFQALTAKNASLLDQLQWAHKNEKQYKDAAQEALAEAQRLREALEDMDYLSTCSACLRNTEIVGNLDPK